MNNKILLFISIISLLFASSCKRGDADALIAEISLSEELNIDFREQFHKDRNTEIIAKITTRSEYECDEGKLRTTFEKTAENEILINVIGLDFTEDLGCEGQDVAKTEINLGELPVGVEFNLQILLLGELQTSGTIKSEINSISINLPSNGDAVIVENQLINKIPTGTAWGFIGRDTNLPDSTLQQFINTMESAGSPLENSGVYGNFKIDQTGDAWINDYELEGRTIAQKGFAIKLNEDFTNLEEFATTQFCMNNQRVRMWDTEGNYFTCD